MEVPPMTRTEAVKEFFKKAVLPVAIAGLLYWRLLVAAWYVPLTIYRLIVGY